LSIGNSFFQKDDLMSDLAKPEPDDKIGRLYVAEMHLSPRIFAEDTFEPKLRWAVAEMAPDLGYPPLGGKWGRAWLYAERLVRCFEACRGVPDEVLEPGSVARLLAEQKAAEEGGKA
jgi:hypothetical protein